MTVETDLPAGVKSAESEWMDLLKTAFWAVLFALIIRSFLFEPFNIPSSSMKPNLLIGDYLFVSKYSYGYSRYSFPFGLPLYDNRETATKPQRGDVIVFKLPTDNRTDYIKRLIGLPGDRIQVIDGRLFINGEMLKREEIPLSSIPADGYGSEDSKAYIETLPEGRTHLVVEDSDEGPLDNTQLYIVPEGHYFMMGDNRDNSQDSRVQSIVGYVPVENLVGRADRLFFSLDEGAHGWEFWKWPVHIRYSRLFDSIK